MENAPTWTGFSGDHHVLTGDLAAVLRAAKARVDHGEAVLLFDDDTGRRIDVDFRGTAEEVVARAAPPAPSPGRGRPKLGVVSREVSLLPRHWEWLEAQPNGISAALRRLIDDARRTQPDAHRDRRAREAAHRFMTTMSGDRPGYEEALRALFAGDRDRFQREVAPWPEDVRAYATRLAWGGG